MVIKIEVEHAVKLGKEKEVLGIIQELNRRGLDRPASALWREMVLSSEPPEKEPYGSIIDNPEALARDCMLLLDNSARVKLHLSA